MRKRYVLMVVCVIVCAGLSAKLIYAVATQSPWVSSADPSLEKIVDLPDNVAPAENNIDCQKITTRFVGTSNAMQEQCVVDSALGLVGESGIIFNGSTEAASIAPPAPFFNLMPVPHQSLLYTYTSASLSGLYMHFYRSIQDKLSSYLDVTTGRRMYTLTKPPDFTLRDAAGKSVPINPSSLAFSANGNWMAVDLPFKGFVRVNMATLEMTPFAPSMNQGSDYANQQAQVSISNDGRYVAAKPYNFDYFRIYDVDSCDGATLPVDPAQPKCQSRDYLPYLTSHIAGFRMLYQPRFINSTQLSFNVVYNYQAGKFKVFQQILTAPGESNTGISYLGMGDSFASGQGAFNYLAGTDTDNNYCHLSSRSYPELMSGLLFVGGHSVACSGAVTDDVTNLSGRYSGQVKDKKIKDERSPEDKVGYLTNFTPGFLAQSEFVETYKPQAVTLSIGGNNIGFSNIILSCVSPIADEPSCFPTYEDQLEQYKTIQGAFDKLVKTYTQVRKPGKRVYVVGYPQIAVAGGNCANNVRLDDREIQIAIGLTDYLNSVISKAAQKAGVQYVDVSQALAGHKMCETASSQVAINGFTAGTDDGIKSIKFVGSESYHPNALGHELMERAIRSATNNLTTFMPTPDMTVTPPGIPSIDPSSLLPKTNRATRLITVADDMVDTLVVANSPIKLTLDATTALLKPNTSYSVEVHSTPVQLGTVNTNAMGSIDSTITFPTTVTPGYHTLHILGQNFIGQPIDIYKTIYVAASPEDYNGDGVPNTTDPCVFLPASGQDVDKDGLDDGCDPTISEPPPTNQAVYRVRLTGNSITATQAPH